MKLNAKFKKKHNQTLPNFFLHQILRNFVSFHTSISSVKLRHTPAWHTSNWKGTRFYIKSASDRHQHYTTNSASPGSSTVHLPLRSSYVRTNCSRSTVSSQAVIHPSTVLPKCKKCPGPSMLNFRVQMGTVSNMAAGSMLHP